jgi:hypothetical protein
MELGLGEGGDIRMRPGVRSEGVASAYVSSASVNLLRSLQERQLTEREGRGRLGTCCRCSSSSGPARQLILQPLSLVCRWCGRDNNGRMACRGMMVGSKGPRSVQDIR